MEPFVQTERVVLFMAGDTLQTGYGLSDPA
jgi:hypothetical protein